MIRKLLALFACVSIFACGREVADEASTRNQTFEESGPPLVPLPADAGDASTEESQAE
jgi:hypothetical protein